MEIASYYYYCSPEYIQNLKPNSYLAHCKNAISGMANFDIAKNTLKSIGLDVPIWLVGIGAEK